MTLAQHEAPGRQLSELRKGGGEMMKLSRINKDQRLYVMPCGSGFTCYGFDVLDRKARALTAEIATLVKNLPSDLQDTARELVTPWSERKGTKKAFYHYASILDFAATINKRIGYRFEYELNQQLKGLYGCRVEVETLYGTTRRFWVGRSTGFCPIYLEIPRRDSTGGMSAESEYKSVKVIGWSK